MGAGASASQYTSIESAKEAGIGNDDIHSYLLDQINTLKSAQSQPSERTVLKDLDLFVLDNSLRESTVGQIRGHTLDDKLKIFEEVKRCGFTNMIVASFSNLPRVEDAFMEVLVKRGENMKGMFAFTDVANFNDGAPDPATIPVGLKKMKKYGIPNIIIEIDLAGDCKIEISFTY